MVFTSLGNADTVGVERQEPERIPDGWRYTSAPPGDGSLVVEIREQRCGDSMSGRPFPHTVTVRVGSQVYWLITSPPDKPLADDLLDDVLR